MAPGIQLRDDGFPLNLRTYEYKSATVTVAGTDPTTDLSGISGFTALFTGVPKSTAYKIQILASGTAYVRLNSVTNDPITLSATSPLPEILWGTVTNKIFVATGGAGVTITVILQ